MCWASFFGTGDTKYLDKLISNLPYSENRADLNLFTTGFSAKWSLCLNANTYLKVKSYLIALKDKNEYLDELLRQEPEQIRDNMVTILKAQKAKGIWK